MKITDPMDQYSIPAHIEKHKLSRRFKMKPRRDPKKSGRELVVTFDDRELPNDKFKLRYSYYVRFFKKRNGAGNHYHKLKQEILIPITGRFEVVLQDIETDEREKFILSASDHDSVYIKPFIAHKVVALKEDTVLLVMASSQNSDGDEFPYIVT